jgi:hypothetical protein
LGDGGLICPELLAKLIPNFQCLIQIRFHKSVKTPPALLVIGEMCANANL